MHPSCLSAVDDMIQLGELSEAGILRNLFIRYYGQKIYVSWHSLAIDKYMGNEITLLISVTRVKEINLFKITDVSSGCMIITNDFFPSRFRGPSFRIKMEDLIDPINSLNLH